MTDPLLDLTHFFKTFNILSLKSSSKFLAEHQSFCGDV